MFLYAIGIPGECIKFGIATDIQKRLSGIQVGFPIRLKIIQFMPMPTRAKAREMEKRIHHSLDFCRLNGEWFEYTPETQAVISLLEGPMVSLTAQLNRWDKNPNTKKIDVLKEMFNRHFGKDPVDYISAESGKFKPEYRRRFQ